MEKQINLRHRYSISIIIKNIDIWSVYTFSVYTFTNNIQ